MGITFFAVLVTTALAVYAFYKSRAIEKMGLDTKIDDKVELAEPGGKIARLQHKAEKQREAEDREEAAEEAAMEAKK